MPQVRAEKISLKVILITTECVLVEELTPMGTAVAFTVIVYAPGA